MTNNAPAASTAPTATPTFNFKSMITRVWHGCLYGAGLGLVLGFFLHKMLPVWTFEFAFAAVFVFVLIAAIRQDIAFLWSAPAALAAFIGKIFLFLVSVWGLFSLAGMITGVTFAEFSAELDEAGGFLGLFDAFTDNKGLPPDVGVGLLILGLSGWLATSVLVTKTVKIKKALFWIAVIFIAIVCDEKFLGGATKLLPERNVVKIEERKLREDADSDFANNMEKLRKQLRRHAITQAQFNTLAQGYKKELDERHESAAKLTVPVGGSSSAPPPPAASGLPTPSPSVTPLGTGKWQVVFPANLEHRTGIKVSAGQTVTFTGWVGEVKLNPQEIFTNPPTGRYDVSTMTYAVRKPFVHNTAFTGTLLAKVGGQGYADVGGRVGNSFRATADGEVILSVNCLADERNFASGSFTGTIEVR